MKTPYELCLLTVHPSSEQVRLHLPCVEIGQLLAAEGNKQSNVIPVPVAADRVGEIVAAGPRGLPFPTIDSAQRWSKWECPACDN